MTAFTLQKNGFQASMDNPQKVETLIVGGGAVGLSCAIALREAGRQVRVIEARHVGSG